MKRLLFLLALVAMTRIGFGQQAPTPVPIATGTSENAVFEWTALVHDFGKIKQGVPVSHEFKFTNKGKVPLIIANVQASCGCTTPDWTKDAIPPGQTGFIKATFSAASPGAFDKTVTVTANVENGSVQLKIKGEVAPQVP
jgi:hypothetical protein